MKHEVLWDELLETTKELSKYHDVIVESLFLLATVVFTTSNRTHKSVHTSFIKSP